MQRLKIDPQSWPELTRLLDTALELPPAARDAWVEALDDRHLALKPQLRNLLSRGAQIDTSEFLNTLPKLDAASSDRSSRESETEQPGTIIGAYRLIKELGVGGMGAVWLAERTDGLIKRPVALKLPHGAWKRAGLAERMARERDILATLAHPHIARLYDAGVTAEGQPYLALEYVEGRPMDAHCRDHQCNLAQRLQLFSQVADAVAYAHGKLVVHRDLKPANILVTSDGQVRLLDFGVAKLLNDDLAKETRLTLVSGRALTLDYASPEQILGEPLTVASDVYSLGVLLYELLSGVRPYKLKRDSRGALEDAILEIEPAKPSQVATDSWRNALPGDLDTIVLKALKKRAEDRYPTVHALLEDLKRYESNRPVLAQADSRLYRLLKFAKRNRVAVGAVSAVAIALIAGTAVALWQASAALQEKESADAVRDFIVSIFRDADPYGRSGQASTGADLLRRARSDIENRFAHRPDLKIDLLNVVGSGLLNLDDLSAAESALSQAIDESTRIFGPTHARTLEVRATLTELHSARSERDLLKEELKELIPLARPLRRTHPEVLVRLLKNRANLAFEEGRFDDMQSAAREAFELSLHALGRHHALTLASSALLSQSFVIAPHPREVVLRETQRALDLALEAHGGRDDHPSVIRAREHRGRALAVTGHVHEAVAEMRKAVAGLETVFGVSSRASLYAALNLAPWERRIGDLLPSLNRTSAALQELAGRIETDSMDYAFGLTTRGVTLIAARRATQALTDLAAAEATYRRILGDQHWDTLTAQFNRAVALAYLGRFAEADMALAPLQNPATPILRRDWALHVKGIVERKRGNWDEAIADQREAERSVQAGPRADWDRVRIIAERGIALAERGDHENAATTLTQARDLYEKLKVRMHPDYADVLVALGRIRLQQNNAVEAVEALAAADAFWRDFDPNDAFAKEAARWLARAREQAERSDRRTADGGRCKEEFDARVSCPSLQPPACTKVPVRFRAENPSPRVRTHCSSNAPGVQT